MPSISDFQEKLQTQFDGPLASAFDLGVEVVLSTSETTPESRVGKPRLLLSLESDVVSRWNGAKGTLRDCVVKFEAQASEGSGSLVGAENPSPVQVEIARALQQYVSQTALALHGEGYMMPEIRMEKSDTTGLISSSSGRFLFTYDES